MKKSVLALAMAFGVTGAFAQDLTSKKGEPYLPEAGDWSIGIDATPFFSYAKSLVGAGANASSPSFNFLTGNQTITGKMFKDEKTAYRGSLRIGFGGSKVSNEVNKRYDTGGAPTTVSFPSRAEMVVNERKNSSKNIALAGGIEMRRGKTRLQGYYGGELGFGISGSKSKYTYGNALTGSTATTAGIGVTAADDFGDGNFTASQVSQGQTDNARVTERKNAGTFTFGLRGFIGAEYFIFPKLSIAGEFGWGLGMTKLGASKTTYETRGMSTSATTESVGTIEIEGQKSGNWALDTDGLNSVFGPASTIRLNLHF